MVLRPIGEAPLSVLSTIPAWNAIEPRQLGRSTQYWLVTQPDHAELAGKLGAAISAEWMPRLSPEAVQAIAIHDAGWEAYDGQIVLKNGRPASFLEFSAPDYLSAWSGSIEQAASLSPLGGVMVSRHFSRILQSRVHSPDTAHADRVVMQNFLRREAQREAVARLSISDREVEALVDVLQLCDLLSLYLCCGATESVEFPQVFAGRSLQFRCNAPRTFVLEPSLSAGSVSFT